MQVKVSLSQRRAGRFGQSDQAVKRGIPASDGEGCVGDGGPTALSRVPRRSSQFGERRVSNRAGLP